MAIQTLAKRLDRRGPAALRSQSLAMTIIKTYRVVNKNWFLRGLVREEMVTGSIEQR